MSESENTTQPHHQVGLDRDGRTMLAFCCLAHCICSVEVMGCSPVLSLLRLYNFAPPKPFPKGSHILLKVPPLPLALLFFQQTV